VILEKTVPIFPLPFWHFWAGVYSVIFTYLIPIRKKTAVSNLKLAFPDKNNSEITAIVKGAYRNVLIVIYEFFYMRKMKMEKLRKMVRLENAESIDKALSKGKGVVMLSGHFGNWELMVYGCSRLTGHIFNIIVKEQTNTKLDTRLNMIRESCGNKTIEMQTALRPTLKTLSENGIIAMLGDQSAPKEGSVKVDFFVKDVPTFEGAARFSIKTGAPLIFGYILREKDNTYTLNLKEVDMSRYREYTEENVKALTQEHAKMLETVIREHPEHWLWFHKRFKHVLPQSLPYF
jgi:KDO2-lipid IV(A) lauroyltransferase